MVNKAFTIREMTGDDLDVGLRLGTLSGWNQVQSDWRRIFNYEPRGCFVAMVNGDTVATISTTTYGKDLAWIGMMLVHPDFRRQGIATALMKHAIGWLHHRGTACIKLDATPAGAEVYSRLGFKNEWNFHRFQREPTATKSAPDTDKTLFSTPAFDESAFGVNRQPWLDCLAADSTVISRSDGYGMLRPGRLATYLGPVVATSPETAAEIISVLNESVATQIFWDIPGPNHGAVTLAEGLGFQPVRPLTRMWLGEKLIESDPLMQFALASPATG